MSDSNLDDETYRSVTLSSTDITYFKRLIVYLRWTRTHWFLRIQQYILVFVVRFFLFYDILLQTLGELLHYLSRKTFFLDSRFKNQRRALRTLGPSNICMFVLFNFFFIFGQKIIFWTSFSLYSSVSTSATKVESIVKIWSHKTFVFCFLFFIFWDML